MKKCENCGSRFSVFGRMLSSDFSLKGLILDTDDKTKCLSCGAINTWPVSPYIAIFLQFACWIGYVLLFCIVMVFLPFRNGDELYNMLLMFSSLILFSFFYYKVFLCFLYYFRWLFSKNHEYPAQSNDPS